MNVVYFRSKNARIIIPSIAVRRDSVTGAEDFTFPVNEQRINNILMCVKS